MVAARRKRYGPIHLLSPASSRTRQVMSPVVFALKKGHKLA